MQLECLKEEPKSNKHPTPVLFVHGMWHGAWCWAEYFLPYFAQHGYVSYALSLRGHGASEGQKRLRWTSLADYVADVAHIVRQMDKPPILIGHSMGGMVVQKYLESHESPSAVLLASVPPQGLFAATLRILRRDFFTFLKANLTLSLYPIIGTPTRCRELLFSANITDEKLSAYFAQMQDESYRAYIDMIILNLPKPKRIKTPLLVLGATNDAAISVREVEVTAQVYGTQAEIFPEMAHDMMLESGWQMVADRILAWLNERGL
jgi:alpha-beta hydrolase superfamily lysophospholipase